jgi:hypothetical protein
MVGAEISRLLSHYWTTNENQGLREAQARDWLNDLRDFSPEIVAEACGNWRRSENRRPLIADILQRCIEIRERGKPQGPVYVADAEQTKRTRQEWRGKFAEAAAYRENWARQRGHKDFQTAVASGALGQKR